MKKIISFLAIVCFFTGFTAFAPPPATVTDTHFDVCGPFVTVISPCTGENITVTGCIGVDIHTVINGNRVNSTFHASGHLDGVGDQGNTYNVNINVIC